MRRAPRCASPTPETVRPGSWILPMRGIPPILCFSAADRKVRQYAAHAPVLGLMPAAQFSSQSVNSRADDVLLIATDGVLEVANAAGQENGITRLEAVLLAQHDRPLEVLASEIFAAAARWGRQTDDQTLLLMRFGPGSRAVSRPA